MKALELENWLNSYLKVNEFRDCCPNGIQVEGKDEIRRIVTGVSASAKLLEYAARTGADAVLVHHGIFWKGDPQAIRTFRRKRIEILIKNDLNLFAYHLPLDAHPEIGNNVLLAQTLGIEIDGACDEGEKHPLVLRGHLAQPCRLSDFIALIDHKLDRKSFYIGDGGAIIDRIAWCTGAAHDNIELAARCGAGLYISGEIAERTVHEAEELGIAYVAAGHHCTEIFGIRKLGHVLADRFGLDVEFVNMPNSI